MAASGGEREYASPVAAAGGAAVDASRSAVVAGYRAYVTATRRCGRRRRPPPTPTPSRGVSSFDISVIAATAAAGTHRGPKVTDRPVGRRPLPRLPWRRPPPRHPPARRSRTRSAGGTDRSSLATRTRACSRPSRRRRIDPVVTVRVCASRARVVACAFRVRRRRVDEGGR